MALCCWQYREALARMAKGDVRSICISRLDRSDARNQRPLSARLNHSTDRINGSDKQCLNRTVAAISDPTSEAPPCRRLRDPGAKADTLNAPTYEHPAHGGPFRAHRISPLSSVRAAFSPEEDQRVSSLT